MCVAKTAGLKVRTVLKQRISAPLARLSRHLILVTVSDKVAICGPLLESKQPENTFKVADDLTSECERPRVEYREIKASDFGILVWPTCGS